MDQILRIALAVLLCAVLLATISCDSGANHRADRSHEWEERCYKGYVYVVFFGIYQAAITQLLDSEGKPVPCEVKE